MPLATARDPSPAARTGSRERMRAPTQAPLTTANPTARDAGSREHTLWHRRRTAAGSGGRPVTGRPSQWRVIPPPGRQPPVQNPPRGAHVGNKSWLPALRTGGQGRRAPDARRPSQQREHRVPTGAPLALGPPCTYVRHLAGARKQRWAPAIKGVRCEADVRLSPHPTTPTAHAAKRAATGTGKPQEVRTPFCSQAQRHSNGRAHVPTQNAPALDVTHEVIRVRGL